tara:strand:- start:1448 stop:2986 length:1539 start_codon:yes stop_codon:yes gene_type:complete
MSKERFNKLEAEREPFLRRARECAKLTLPLVVRAEDDSGVTDYEVPYQSVGARGVTNLSSNLLLSLFPNNIPFFRLLVSDTEFDSFGPQGEQIKKEVDASLAKIEKTVLEELEDKNLRTSIFEVLKNLIISGNSLVYVQPDGNIRNYSIEDYVCHRDIEGNLTDIIISEQISPVVAQSLDIELPSDVEELGVEKNIKIFTCVQLQEDGQYYVWQEIKGEKVKNTDEYYDKSKLPWLALRLTKVTGESWGRSYVESVIGDLKSLEALQKALVEAAAISAKTVFMVNPASTTRAKSLAKAENGDVINGRVEDVGILRTDKGNDLSTAFSASNIIEKRLSYSFNLLEAAMPSQPAVTATEINAIVNSLEKILAGTYAMLSSEFMAPLVKLIISRLTTENKVPELPDKVKLIISTGLTALGRNSDLERIMQFAQMGAQISPEAFMHLVDQKALLTQLATAIGTPELMKSAEQMAAEQEQAMQEQLLVQEQSEIDLANQTAADVAGKVIPEMMTTPK